jgi:hypothetical protein
MITDIKDKSIKKDKGTRVRELRARELCIPNKELTKEEELSRIEKEIKHHVIELSKVDYKEYPLEIIKGINESLLMSRHTLNSIKAKK